MDLYYSIMKITDEKIEKTLKIKYEISISSIIKLSIGFDQNTSVYKIHSKDNNEFFLKIRSKIFNKASLIIPLWISDCLNAKNVINVVKTTKGKLYAKESLLYFILYPFISGQSGWNKSLTNDQFINFGKFMHHLHSLELPDKYKKLLPIEDYKSKYRNSVKKYLNNTSKNIYEDKIIVDFLKNLFAKKDVIIEIINTSEEIFKNEKNDLQKMRVCHGDIHAGNILISETKFFIIDWDTVLLSPIEKDLMFIGGGICNKWNEEEEINYFYTGYGKSADINRKLLKYYRHERIIQDVYEFYNQIVTTEINEEERELCIKYFNEQFEPNNVVDMALRT